MNIVHKRMLSLISHGGYKKIVCSVGSDDVSDRINAVLHGMTGVASVDRPYVERTLEILGDANINCYVRLEFDAHDVEIDYSALPVEYFVSVTRRSNDVSRWVEIKPNDSGRRIRGATVIECVDRVVAPTRYRVPMSESVRILNDTVAKGLNDEFDADSEKAGLILKHLVSTLRCKDYRLVRCFVDDGESDKETLVVAHLMTGNESEDDPEVSDAIEKLEKENYCRIHLEFESVSADIFRLVNCGECTATITEKNGIRSRSICIEASPATCDTVVSMKVEGVWTVKEDVSWESARDIFVDFWGKGMRGDFDSAA